MRNDGANKHRAITGDWFRARRKWDSGLRSSISRLVRPPGPPPKLIFDQLEARLLMSADPVLVDLSALQPAQQNHDVLVRFLDEVVTIGDQTQHLQRIEAVDRNNPGTVLSSQVIADGSAVKVVGGSGNDHVTLDLSSLGDSRRSQRSMSPAVAEAIPCRWSRMRTSTPTGIWTGRAAEQIDGAAQIEFSNFHHIDGGAEDDTIFGSTIDNNWLINGNGAARSAPTFRRLRDRRCGRQQRHLQCNRDRRPAQFSRMAGPAVSIRWWSIPA